MQEDTPSVFIQSTFLLPMRTQMGKSDMVARRDARHMAKRAATKLTPLPGQDLPEARGSDRFVWFRCECKREVQIRWMNYVRGGSSSCGKCHGKSDKYKITALSGRSFGRLRLVSGQDGETNSKSKLVWRCDCGTERSIQVGYVVRGQTSCGGCAAVLKKWWVGKSQVTPCGTLHGSHQNKYPLAHLIDYFKGHWLTPVRGTSTTLEKIDFMCVCGNAYKCSLGAMWSMKPVSCGCASGMISSQNREILEFAQSITDDCETEFRIGKWSFDVRVRDLLIEYQGLYWHQKGHHAEKNNAAKAEGYRCMMVFGDEWETSRAVVEDVIRCKVGALSVVTKLRPQKCEVRMISPAEARVFAEAHHYQGACPCKYAIGALHEGRLVAIMMIRKPVRQNSGDWEIARMVAVHDVRVHGVWSFLLDRVVAASHITGQMITYSDNRLFDGGVYKAMGFAHISDVPPDYYWCKHRRRYHKSALRKTAQERESGKTERELREAQGYFKVWDLGKRKWQRIV